jgi:hypothetical protein
MYILLNSIDADMKSKIGSSRGGLRPYPLRFHVKEADADAKLIQHGPLGVTYHLPLQHTPRCPVKYSATRLKNIDLCQSDKNSDLLVLFKIFKNPLREHLEYYIQQGGEFRLGQF